MSFLLVVAALGLGGLSIMLTSQVSAGPTVVGLACLCAILARLEQAADHHGGKSSGGVIALRCVACQHRNPVGPSNCQKCGASLNGSGSIALTA